jgi:hypothetical protein
MKFLGGTRTYEETQRHIKQTLVEVSAMKNAKAFHDKCENG